MFCTKCGRQIAEGAKFCAGCGNQIVQSGSKSQKSQQPQMQPPKIQQPEGVQNISNVEAPNMAFHLQKTQETKQMENKNKHMMIILFVILIILIFVAIGMAVYYFSVLKNDRSSVNVETEEVAENSDSDGESTDDVADSETDDVEEEMNEEESISEQEQEEEEEPKVTSDTNEVIKDTILYSIPKAVYSYDFDEDLGSAQVVIRNELETMPVIANDVEPQYVSGIDGKAVYLNGTYGIRLSDVQKVGTSYSMAFWMKADAFYDWSPFVHIGYNLLDQSQRCRLWLGQKTDRSSVSPILSSENARYKNSFEIRPTGALTSMQPGVWYYIVFTVDGTRSGSSANSLYGTLYVAGQNVGEGNIALDTMNVDDLDVYLGINCWDILYPVSFDDVKIWDQVLDAGQVEDLFNAYQ